MIVFRKINLIYGFPFFWDALYRAKFGSMHEQLVFFFWGGVVFCFVSCHHFTIALPPTREPHPSVGGILGAPLVPLITAFSWSIFSVLYLTRFQKHDLSFDTECSLPKLWTHCVSLTLLDLHIKELHGKEQMLRERVTQLEASLAKTKDKARRRQQEASNLEHKNTSLQLDIDR